MQRPGFDSRQIGTHSGGLDHALNLEAQDPCTGYPPPVQAEDPAITKNR